MDIQKDAGAVERREYNRSWRAKNRDRVRKYNEDYWRRRAEKRKGAKDDATNENDSRSGEAYPGD